MKACTSTGGVCPTCMVPGMCSSETTSRSLKSEVVGAKEPIPSVSKKLVTNPIPSSSGEVRSPGSERSTFHQRIKNPTPKRARPRKIRLRTKSGLMISPRPRVAVWRAD